MSYQMRIDPKSRKAARFISSLQKKLQAALIESGKTQQEIAQILGVDRSVINRRLSGSANLTARSIAELAYALDKTVIIDFTDPESTRNKANYAKPSVETVSSPKTVDLYFNRKGVVSRTHTNKSTGELIRE